MSLVDLYQSFLSQVGDPAAAAILAVGAAQNAEVTPPEEEFLTIGQVGKKLCLSAKTIRRRIHDGTLPPPVKIGRATRFRRIDIENYRGKYI